MELQQLAADLRILDLLEGLCLVDGIDGEGREVSGTEARR
jgi:hypothetical protein